MQMETLIAAAVLAPALGAVAACNAWTIFIQIRERLTASNGDRRDLDC